jgi:hypothetical protein
MLLETWGNGLKTSFNSIWDGVASFVPNLVIAVIIFIIGWVVGSLVGKAVAHILRTLKLDTLLKSANFDEVVKRAGYNLDSGRFIGGLVKWFIIIGFLVASLDALGLEQVNFFLQNVVLFYLPRVIIAVLILLVSVVIADTVQHLVTGSARAANIRSANFLGAFSKWVILVFALLTALVQVGIADSIFITIIGGIVTALSLALGLAFGLGGQQAASEVISQLRREVTNRQ